jgi:hypothetical protein
MWGTQKILNYATPQAVIQRNIEVFVGQNCCDIQQDSVSIWSVLSALWLPGVVERNVENTECCCLLDYKPRFNPSPRDGEVMYDEMFEIPCSCLWIMSFAVRIGCLGVCVVVWLWYEMPKWFFNFSRLSNVHFIWTVGRRVITTKWVHYTFR